MTRFDGPHWADRLGALALPHRVFAVWVACVLVTGAVNALSVTSDLTRRGVSFGPSEPWIWEMTSAVALVLLGLPVAWFDRMLCLRVPKLGWRAAAYVLGSVVFCIVHVAAMVGMRLAIYGYNGWHYDFGPWLESFVYEYRKDALTFAVFVGCLAIWRAMLRGGSAQVVQTPTVEAPVPGSSGSGPASPMAEPTFVVRTTQGDVLVRAAEIEWVEAQGNYVALHTAADVRLLRQTLAEMEIRLAPHGFIRTHRRALVARRSMQAIVPPERGDPGVRLASGGLAPLSESRRADVMRQIAGE